MLPGQLHGALKGFINITVPPLAGGKAKGVERRKTKREGNGHEGGRRTEQQRAGGGLKKVYVYIYIYIYFHTHTLMQSKPQLLCPRRPHSAAHSLSLCDAAPLDQTHNHKGHD